MINILRCRLCMTYSLLSNRAASIKKNRLGKTIRSGLNPGPQILVFFKSNESTSFGFGLIPFLLCITFGITRKINKKNEIQLN